VLVHNIVQQTTQTDIINITTKANKQEILLPEVCAKKICWVKLPSMHEKILQELEGFQLANEILKSRGFSGSFCWLGVVASFM
jgi:hypothetical protein